MDEGGNFTLQTAARPLQTATLRTGYYWQPIGSYQRTVPSLTPYDELFSHDTYITDR